MDNPVPLSKLLATVDTAEGRQRVANYLASQPYPHYEQAPDRPDLLVRIEENGERCVGFFKNGKFHTCD